MARGQVVSHKHNSDMIIIESTNTYTIFDMRVYEVRFHRDKMTQLTANIITQVIYAQCITNSNEYLFLDPFIYYDKAVDLRDQKFVVKSKPFNKKSAV